MEILSLSIVLVVLCVSDEIVNGQMKTSQRLLEWFDTKRCDRRQSASQERF